MNETPFRPLLEGYLTANELAAELGVTRRTLQRWERLRIGPPYTKAGGAALYRVEAVRQWLRDCETPAA